MPNAKLWLKNRLERLSLAPFFVRTDVLKQAKARELQIIIPHRLNWKLTTATVHAFQRLTTGPFGITVVVNFDEVPGDWDGFKQENLTLVRNSLTPLGRLFRGLYKGVNGSMENAIALEKGLQASEPATWAFVAHSDSAPLQRGWNEAFAQALGNGLLCGNVRDTTRVKAAHASGTLFSAREFRQRNGTFWPRFHFGEMVYDVGDGITLALHEGPELVKVLPNNRQDPETNQALTGILAKFAENGSNISFAADRRTPVYAHLGRGTPRSQQDPFFKKKLPMDLWIDWINTLN